VQVAPAGDKERAGQGRQWEQRLEVMNGVDDLTCATVPSILFWEAGNNGIPAEQLKEMVELKKKWGSPRRTGRWAAVTLKRPRHDAQSPKYYGVMVGQDARLDALKGPDAMFRAYSAERRESRPVDRDGGLPRRRLSPLLGRLLAALPSGSRRGRTTRTIGTRRRSRLAAARAVIGRTGQIASPTATRPTRSQHCAK